MEIKETIYEGVVDFFINITKADSNHAGHSIQKRGESVLSKNYSKMGERAGNWRKRYV